MGIGGNERVDKLAKEAAVEGEEPGQLCYADYYGEIKSRMRNN